LITCYDSVLYSHTPRIGIKTAVTYGGDYFGLKWRWFVFLMGKGIARWQRRFFELNADAMNRRPKDMLTMLRIL
jgi:hypothetical protein